METLAVNSTPVNASRSNANRWRAVVLGALVVMTQVWVVNRFWFFGVHPDLVLGALLIVTMTFGADFGVVAAFVAGLAIDVFMPWQIGLSALAYVVGAAIVGATDTAAGGTSAEDHRWAWPVLAFCASVCAIGVLVVAGNLSGRHVTASRGVWVAAVIAVENAFLCLLVSSWKRRKRRPNVSQRMAWR